MKQSGYSGTPLAKKLGIKEGYVIQLIDEPDYYQQLFSELPQNLTYSQDQNIEKDLIHFFTKTAERLAEQLILLRKQIKQNGMIWVSWPKKSSKVPTDVTEDVIRKYAFQNDLVDVKVCAVDEIWSGLKLVIRLKDRK